MDFIVLVFLSVNWPRLLTENKLRLINNICDTISMNLFAN